MIHTIRPWKLFDLVAEQQACDRITQIKIPVRRMRQYADYSLRLLELMALTACIRIVDARRIFEFGTFLGNTTLHLALNSPADAVVTTLDADDETLARIGLLDVYQWRESFPLEFLGTPVEHKVRTLRGDSHTFVSDSPADLVLIDGDHSGKGVSVDTSNAFRMGPDCVLWHDYGNPLCRENDRYLNELSTSCELFHLADTMLVVYFSDSAIVEALQSPV